MRGPPWWQGAPAAGPETLPSPGSSLRPEAEQSPGPGERSPGWAASAPPAPGPRCRGSASDSASSPTAAAGVQPRPRHALRADGEAHPEVPAVHPPASGTPGVPTASTLRVWVSWGGASHPLSEACATDPPLWAVGCGRGPACAPAPLFLRSWSGAGQIGQCISHVPGVGV